MNAQRIIGYILLVLGLVIIFATLYQSWAIFTGSAKPPMIFTAPSSLHQAASQNPKTQEELIAQQISGQLSGLIPMDAIFKSINLFSWSILAGILILGGGKIAGLGIALMKNP